MPPDEREEGDGDERERGRDVESGRRHQVAACGVVEEPLVVDGDEAERHDDEAVEQRRQETRRSTDYPCKHRSSPDSGACVLPTSEESEDLSP